MKTNDFKKEIPNFQGKLGRTEPARFLASLSIFDFLKPAFGRQH